MYFGVQLHDSQHVNIWYKTASPKKGRWWKSTSWCYTFCITIASIQL